MGVNWFLISEGGMFNGVGAWVCVLREHFRECTHVYRLKVPAEDVSLLERCPHFRGWYVQASMELGPEDVSLLERCLYRGWYVQASMELGPEVSSFQLCYTDNLRYKIIPFKVLTRTRGGQRLYV